MTSIYEPRRFVGLAAVFITLFFSGCAATAPGMDPVKGVQVETSDTIVIGKVRLIENGEEVSFGSGMFANSPKLHMTDVRHGSTVRAEVGDNGEFAWPLHAEYYNVTGIEFLVNGQKILFPTYLTFSASPAKDATYVGTITLETDIDRGFYGLTAKASSMSIANECASTCDRQLASLGLDRNDLDIGLLRPDVSLATASNRTASNR